MSGVGSSTISGTPSCFLSLPSAAAAGPEVGDRGGHHDHVVVVGGLLDVGLHLGGGLDLDDAHAVRAPAGRRSTRA